MQKLAEGAYLDARAMGLPLHPEMEMLAACGSHGAHPQNVWRDLERKLHLSENTFPEPLMMTNVPLLDKTQHPPKVVYGNWPIFLMQDVLHWSYHHSKDEFFRRWIGSAELSTLRQYWMCFRADDPRLIDHPVTFIHGWQEIAIPGRFHADGVPYGKSRSASADVANISSPLSTGDTLDTLNLWWWMPKDLITNGTMERVWKYAIWDISVVLEANFSLSIGMETLSKPQAIIHAKCAPVALWAHMFWP